MTRTRDQYGYTPFVNAQSNLRWNSPNNLINNGWTNNLVQPARDGESMLVADKAVATMEYLLRENALLHERINSLTDLTRTLVQLVQDGCTASTMLHPDERVRTLTKASLAEIDQLYGTEYWY